MSDEHPVVQSTPSKVPLSDGQDVTIEPGDPWPSPYRGSKYSLINSPKHGKPVVQWKYDDLQIYLDPPKGLPEVMRSVGKSSGAGTGSFRVTAGRELITKVHIDHYSKPGKAINNDGWVMVYLGRLNGTFQFNDVNIDPDPIGSEEIRVWEGLPFNHGETWAISVYDTLIWKWRGYRFESVFDHPELVARYSKYRTIPGRLYINENGCIWVNIPSKGVPEDKKEDVNKMFTDWQERSKRDGKDSILRLVNRRLKATGGSDTSQGHLPVYIGKATEFDDGLIPRPSVTDSKYYVDAGREPENISY